MIPPWEWVRFKREHPAPDHGTMLFRLCLFRGEGLKRNAIIMAGVDRTKSGEWSWWAVVDERGPRHFGTEPQRVAAMQAALAELAKPVRI